MEKIKILLVDDEEDFVTTLSERIRMRALDADVALNGEEALRILEKQIPDVMILDLKMPGIGGMEVLRRIKKSHPEIQVIILTGHGSEKDADEARRMGAFNYLQKPVELDELIETIRQAHHHSMERDITADCDAAVGERRTEKFTKK